MKFSYKVVIMILLSSLALTGQAQTRWQDPAMDTVVATFTNDQLYPGKLAPTTPLDTLSTHFQRANQLGQSWRYDHIRSLLGQIDPALRASPSVLYFRARLLQHEHKFSTAATLLEQIPPSHRQSLDAQLMLSQVLYQQDLIPAAQTICRRLALKTAPPIVAACMAAASKAFEPKLMQLMTTGLTQTQAPDARAWIQSQLARMALLGSQPDLAWYWAEAQRKEHGLASLSVPDVVFWSELALQQQQPNIILNQLEFLAGTEQISDGILVLLAQAEQQADSLGPWQQRAFERVQLREQRGDLDYAETIARFYLTIKKQPQQAMPWAQRNLANQPQGPEHRKAKTLLAAVEHAAATDVNEDRKP